MLVYNSGRRIELVDLAGCRLRLGFLERLVLNKEKFLEEPGGSHFTSLLFFLVFISHLFVIFETRNGGSGPKLLEPSPRLPSPGDSPECVLMQKQTSHYPAAIFFILSTFLVNHFWDSFWSNFFVINTAPACEDVFFVNDTLRKCNMWLFTSDLVYKKYNI